MKTITLNEFNFTSDLGQILLKNVAVYLDEEDYSKFQNDISIDQLDFGLSGDVIIEASREVAKKFFKDNYRDFIDGKFKLKTKELRGIQDILNLSNSEFSKILFIDKGTLTNIYKRESCSKQVAGIALERLGMELTRRGSAKRLLRIEAALEPIDQTILEEFNAIRYG